MPWHVGVGYPLTQTSLVRHAPISAGVYAIYSGRRWIYFGESDDLRRRLLEHVLDKSHCMHAFPDLHFSVERTPNPPDRLRALLLEYRTPCNSMFE